MSFRIAILARPLIGAALVITFHQVCNASYFPIGAWWPGMKSTEASTFARKFAQLDSAHFNTVHTANEDPFPSPTANDTLLATAVDSSFAVQLYSWYCPSGWMSDRYFWTKTLEAEDDIFDHAIGQQSGNTWKADKYLHSPGLMLDTPDDEGGIFLRRIDNDWWGRHGSTSSC